MTKLAIAVRASAIACALATAAQAEPPPGRASDPRYGPNCWEGAPPTDDNIDCPLPLHGGGSDGAWDDLFTFGLTMRLTYAPLKMGGLGFAGRSFVARSVAFETGADVLGGVDENGDRRTEIPLFVDALLYFHRGPEVQAYLLGGAFVAFARVQSSPDRIERDSSFGPRIGAGFELRGARDLRWSLDLVGFERIELTDDSLLTGRAALLRVSATIYPH